MKQISEFVVSAFVTGLLLLVPIYLAVLLLLKAMQSAVTTVFVPSVPTPFAGAVSILSRERVHPLEVPFTQALRSVSRWGAGSKDLVAAMKTEHTPKLDIIP